jgi:CDP-diacylglycerol--serine O-phosphatidyltransferase
MDHSEGRLRFIGRADARPHRRLDRGAYLLPSLFTLVNMFCGYACVVYAMRGEYETAAPFIGFAIVLDMLDGRIARMTGTESEFGVELDSLADVISFGIAPAILAFGWGLSSLGRLGWLAGFLFVTAAAVRLARFNIQSHAEGDKRYFIGLPSPAAAAVIASTVYFYPSRLDDYRAALPALALVLVPAALMVSTIRFRSFKSFDLKSRRPHTVVVLIAAIIALIATHPQIVLIVLAYAYLSSAFLGQAVFWLRHRKGGHPAPAGGRSAHEPIPADRDATRARRW